MTDKVPFGPAIRRLIQDRESAIDRHPSLADLLAYHDGRLPEERVEGLRDHVAICSACATTLLEFAQDPVSDRRRRRPEVQSRTREEDGVETPQDASENSEPSGHSHRAALDNGQSVGQTFLRWVGSGGTPFLLGFCLLLLIWSVLLELEVRRFSEPQVLDGMVELWSLSSSGTRGEARVESVSASGRNLIILSLFEIEPHTKYRVQIRKAGQDDTLWTSPEIHGGANVETVIFQVPRGFLSPGQYTIRLNGLDAGSETQVAEYRLHVDSRVF